MPTVVVGIDGSGRTHRLRALAASWPGACWVPGGTGDGPELVALLRRAGQQGTLVVVDDAHLLPPAVLGRLLTAARSGTSLAVARRPTIEQRELAELDDVVAATGRVEMLAALGEADLARLLAAGSGRPPHPAAVEELRLASGGLAAVAAALAQAAPDPAPPLLRARVQRRLARLPPDVGQVARLLALGPGLSDATLAAAAGLELDALAEALRVLRDNGFLVPPGEAMVPAVAALVQDELSPAERRRVHDAVARALQSTGGDAVETAQRLRAAQARTPQAAQAYLAAGEQLRLSDPGTAAGWYAEALESGLDPARAAAGQAETALLLGLDPVTAAPPGGAPGDLLRLRIAEAVTAAHQGRSERAGHGLAGIAPSLAAVPLAATGRVGPAGSATGPSPAGAVELLAEGVRQLADPAAALPILIEAAEAVQAHPSLLLPDTPHAVGAVLAVTAGDATTAEHLLRQGLIAGVGGPAGERRHRLLLAWTRMRTGRFDTAVAEVAAAAATPLPGRERLLLNALQAGLARRSGDIAQLRASWASAEHVLARRAVDLLQLEALEELLVAAARLRHPHRVAPVLQVLQDQIDRLARPPTWVVSLAWLRLQVAVAVDDGAEAARLADQLGAVPDAGPRQAAQQRAAWCWALVLRDEVDADEVAAAADGLTAAGLPWEASRLAGQAAIRTGDPALARRLLERARELSAPEPAPAADGGDQAAPSGLSEREVEVARLVLAGRTHREIGAQLYLSPKTVEHHVARIRTKLGATSRADFHAALRRALGPHAG